MYVCFQSRSASTQTCSARLAMCEAPKGRFAPVFWTYSCSPYIRAYFIHAPRKIFITGFQKLYGYITWSRCLLFFRYAVVFSTSSITIVGSNYSVTSSIKMPISFVSLVLQQYNFLQYTLWVSATSSRSVLSLVMDKLLLICALSLSIDNHYRVSFTKLAFCGNRYIPQHWNHSPIFFISILKMSSLSFSNHKTCAGSSPRGVNCLVNP